MDIEQSTIAFNQALYKADPMHTGSVENELEDEYERIAHGIAVQVNEGISLEEAVAVEFEFWFGEEPDSPKVLEAISALKPLV